MDNIRMTVNEQLRRINLLMRRTEAGRFGAHTPHRGQGRVLAILRLKPEISQRELTYLLDMSRQGAAELLAKLEKAGYITREQSQDDRRVMTVRLTEKGLEESSGPDEAEAQDDPLNRLSEEELFTLSDCLKRIIEGYEESFPDDGFEERRRAMEELETHGPHGPHHSTEGPHGPHRGPEGPHGPCGPRGPEGPHGTHHGPEHGGPHGPHHGPENSHGPHHGPEHGGSHSPYHGPKVENCGSGREKCHHGYGRIYVRACGRGR